MIVGPPRGFTSAMLLPATSVVTESAKVDASSRHTRAAGPSYPDGPGVSSRRFRNARDDGESTASGMRGTRRDRVGHACNLRQADSSDSGGRGGRLIPHFEALP